MYTRRSRSHEDNRYFVASFSPSTFDLMCKNDGHASQCSAFVQIQAAVSQRVERTIPVALQVSHTCRKPRPVFPLHRGRSATDTVPLAIQVQVCVEIPLPITLSLPILGRTQVRGPLDHLLSLFFFYYFFYFYFFPSYVKKSVGFDTNVMSPNYL